MQNILLIAFLISIAQYPSRVIGAERYAARDTTVVNLLIKEADSLRNQAIALDKAHVVLTEALLLAKETKHREGEVRRRFAFNLAELNKMDSALLAYNELFNYCIGQNDFEGLAESYYSAGGAFENKSKINEAESFYLEGINQAEKHGLQAQHCKYLRMLSNFYEKIGQWQKALDAAEKALRVSKQYGSEEDVALSSMQLGNIFTDLNDYQSAYTYFLVHRNYVEKKQDTLNMARAQVNFGNYHFWTSNNDSAVYYYKKAVSYFNISGNKSRSVDALYNMASAYYMLDSITQFLKYLDEAEAIYTTTSNHYGLLNVLYNRAEYLKFIGDFNTLISLSRKAIQTCLETENRELRKEFYEKLAEAYQSIEKYDSAIYFNRAYIALYDSINTEELREGLITADMEHRYNAKEREKEIEVLKLLNQRRLYIMWGLGLMVLLTIIIAVVGIRSLRHKRNLAETRLKLHEQKIEQLLSNQELKSINAMMEGQDKERKRIAQDLHDRLGSMLSTVKHHFSAMETRITELQDQNKVQYNTAIALLDDAVREVRHISHDMLSGTLIKFGLTAALQDLKNTIEVPGKFEVDLNTFGIDHRLENDIEIAVYRIIQELVGNTLKHAKANHLSIQLTLSEDNLNVMVEDNGIGFKPEAVKSNGIGMQNIYDRIARQNGTYHLDSEIGRGTTFVFDIPVKTNH